MQQSEPFHLLTISTINYLYQQTLQGRLFKFAILQKKKKKTTLQYTTIIRINLFESNKNFISTVNICNKL